MAENLPEPKSRKESYLAKAAGMDVTVPEAPESREEQYLAAIAEGGGGGGGTSNFNDLTNRPKYNGSAMTGDTNIPLAPTVVQTTGTSQTDVMSQNAVTSMVFADPATAEKVSIATTQYIGSEGIGIGVGAMAGGQRGVAIGRNASAQYKGAVAIGAGASASTAGEFNISTNSTQYGYNGTSYRLLTGLYDPQTAHDAATKGYVDGLVGNVAAALNAINNGTAS